MASIIFYVDNYSYFNTTLRYFLDFTDPLQVDQVIVCNDQGGDISCPGCKIIKSDNIGISKSWNIAARQATSDILVFCRGIIKFSDGWLKHLIDEISHHNNSVYTSSCISSPTVFDLDTKFWSSIDDNPGPIGFRWDMSLYHRPSTTTESAVASPACLAILKDRFDTLKGFDESLESGDGEVLDLSIRHKLSGGSIRINSSSKIAASVTLKYNSNNLARIVEKSLPDYAKYFYHYSGMEKQQCDTRKIAGNPATSSEQQSKYLLDNLPELIKLPRLFGSASGKTVAVVNDGPSMDHIDRSWIYKHDLIVSLNYMGLAFESDYVMANDTRVVEDLRAKYREDRFVLPFKILSVAHGKLIDSLALLPESHVFESSGSTSSIHPPFLASDIILHSAVHFALFLRPKSIFLYGCDNKIINGKSHTSILEQYNHGEVWNDSAAIRKRFAAFESGLNILNELANKNGVPIIRINHVGSS